MPEQSPQWRQYQDRIAGLFRSLGLVASANATLQGARGVHDVDVLVKLTVAGVTQTWIVECKDWKRRARKEQVLALSALVDDVGADAGFLFCETGFQSGAEAQAMKSRIRLLAAADLQAVLDQARTVAIVPFVQDPTGHRMLVSLQVGETSPVSLPAVINTGAPISIVPHGLAGLDDSEIDRLTTVEVRFGASAAARVYGPVSCRMTLPDTIGGAISWRGFVYLAPDSAGLCTLGRQGFMDNFDVTIRSSLDVVELSPTAPASLSE